MKKRCLVYWPPREFNIRPKRIFVSLRCETESLPSPREGLLLRYLVARAKEREKERKGPRNSFDPNIWSKMRRSFSRFSFPRSTNRTFRRGKQRILSMRSLYDTFVRLLITAPLDHAADLDLNRSFGILWAVAIEAEDEHGRESPSRPVAIPMYHDPGNASPRELTREVKQSLLKSVLGMICRWVIAT